MITEVPLPEPPEDDAELARRMAEAARLHDWLTGHGAVFTLSPEGELRANLDGVATITSFEQADLVSRAVLALSGEITALIHRRASVTH